MQRLRSSAALALAALTSAACGAGDNTSGGAWQAVTDTIGDTIVVRTIAGGVWNGPAELVPEVRIGVFEGDDEYMLGDVSGLAAAPDGSIYLYDRQVPALRKYAPDGTFVATFGREGGGPGEYANSDGGLAVLADGRVALRDPGNGRITIFSPDGEALDELPLRGGFYTSSPLVPDSAGRLHTQVLMDAEASVTEWRMGMARYSWDGPPEDTIAAPTWDFEPAQLIATSEDGRSTSVNNVPFSRRTHWAFSPLGYMAGGVSTRYAIDLYRPDGVLRIERELEPVRVLDAERRNQEARATANMRRMVSDWRWNGPPIPDTKPPFRDLQIAHDGRIWVQLSRSGEEIPADQIDEPASDDPNATPPLRWREPIAFDVFEPDGTYLGEVRAPDGFQIYPAPFIRDDNVWAVVTDELGVESVVRYRVSHGPAADELAAAGADG